MHRLKLHTPWLRCEAHPSGYPSAKTLLRGVLDMARRMLTGEGVDQDGLIGPRRRMPTQRYGSAAPLRRRERRLVPGGDDWDACVRSFQRARRRENLADRTLALDLECLGWLQRRLPLVGCPAEPTAVRRHHIDELIDGMLDGRFSRPGRGGDGGLAQGLKGRSVNSKLQRWKVFFEWLCHEGYIAESPLVDIVELQEVEEEITWLYGDSDGPHPDELGQLFDSMRQAVRRYGQFHLFRDYAAAVVQTDGGLRPGELLQLVLADVDLDARTIRLSAKASKVRRWRHVFLSQQTVDLLRRYLAEREAQGFECPQVFPGSRDNRNRAGEVQPLLTSTYSKGLQRYARNAGLTKKVTGYTLRHTFARLYLRNGGGLADLQSLLGHRNPSQVLRYTRLWGTDLQEAHDRFSPMRRRLA